MILKNLGKGILYALAAFLIGWAANDVLDPKKEEQLKVRDSGARQIAPEIPI
jgi:hypothetical protein